MTTSQPHTTETTDVDVLAAGAVLWRRAAHGVELAVVHRQRYDDWSFPKGKCDAGESLPFTAAREIAEETGHVPRLDAIIGDVHYDVPDGRKLVRYWSAEARHGTFTPNGETDELRWLPPDDAAALLSYAHDVRILERFTSLGPPASTIVLVRHAKAGSRNRWEGDDSLRPLSDSGREQAQQLTDLLSLFGPDRVLTAPPLRCRDTVVPLAERLRLSIDEEPLVGEVDYWKDPAAGIARAREIAQWAGVSVVSSQGGVVPDIVGTLAAEAELPGLEPDEVPARKGSTWLLTFGPEAQLRSADYYEHPTG